MSKEQINFIPIENIKSKHFIVKDYQRGYKWQKEQIVALLNDINNHKEGKYCLQPVIVNTNEDGVEVIDGQQRITSIYLLLYYLERQQYYTIDYQTRKSTQAFLKNDLELLYTAIENKIEWSNFIETNKVKGIDNVDVFHIYTVFKEIHNWFIDKVDNLNQDQFKEKIKKEVYIIWYDVSTSTTNKKAEDIFLNLNAGKIPLTNSELIKALFVLDVQKRYPSEISELKSYEITNEWDLIENQLHNDSFWFFICDHNYYNTIDTRIDFIIDLANEVQPKKRWDGKDAYRNYEQQYYDNEILDWNKIKQTFNKLTEWFSDDKDKELYHYIGFLVNTNISTLTKILKLSKNKSKTEFKIKLVELIKIEFKKTKKKDNKEITYYQLDNLNYTDYRVACQNILLLLNIERYNKDLSSNKFPFDLYKKEKWSVEHINPQNPKDFKNLEAVINWLTSFKTYFENKKIEEELISKISKIVNVLNLEDSSKRLSDIRLNSESRELLVAIVENITGALELHHISNLTLLDRNTNSKLSNKVFIDKRTELLKLYYNGKKERVFIPESTKDVFTKNYTVDKNNITDEIFGLQDMIDYNNHIECQLSKHYLK